MKLQFTKPYDLIVIGGGPAGIMAALSAKHYHPELTVAIVDRSAELGRKLTITGAGRGNITNVNLSSQPEFHYYGDKNLIKQVFSRFGYDQIAAIFERLGIPLYEEKKTGRGKIFPVIDHAKTIRDILVAELKDHKVEIFFDTSVIALQSENIGWILQTADGKLQSKSVILATGGRTYPAFGSDGSGYELAKSLGHTIIAPVPSAVPLVSKNPLSQYLQGEKLVMEVTAFINGKRDKSATGDVMFTQYGLSGPAILDVSRNISIRINRDGKTDAKVRLSFFTQTAIDKTREILTERFVKHPDYPVAQCLWGLLTERAAGAVCAVAKISKERIAKQLNETEKQQLVSVLTAYEVPVTGTRGWNEAEFTAGGIDTDAVNPETLESKKAKGIFFAGEILNVDGPVGGFNLSWAWASGWVAGLGSISQIRVMQYT